MAQEDSPLARSELTAIETTLAADAKAVSEFRVCENGVRLALERICTRLPIAYPGNVAVTLAPAFPTHHRKFGQSRFVTFNRIEAEFVEVRDPRTRSGHRVVVLGYHYV